jgi:ketosteroid isomerase-like protein
MKAVVCASLIAATIYSGGIAMAGTPEDNIKVVHDFFAAYGQNDLAKIAAVLDENVRWHIPGRHPLSGTLQGRDQVLAFFGQLALAGFRAEPIYFGADDKHVVDVHRGFSTVNGAVNVDTTWALIYRIENDKIVEATNLSADQDAANSFFWLQYKLGPVPNRLDD